MSRCTRRLQLARQQTWLEPTGNTTNGGESGWETSVEAANLQARPSSPSRPATPTTGGGQAAVPPSRRLLNMLSGLTWEAAGGAASDGEARGRRGGSCAPGEHTAVESLGPMSGAASFTAKNYHDSDKRPAAPANGKRPGGGPTAVRPGQALLSGARDSEREFRSADAARLHRQQLMSDADVEDGAGRGGAGLRPRGSNAGTGSWPGEGAADGPGGSPGKARPSSGLGRGARAAGGAGRPGPSPSPLGPAPGASPYQVETETKHTSSVREETLNTNTRTQLASREDSMTEEGLLAGLSPPPRSGHKCVRGWGRAALLRAP